LLPKTNKLSGHETTQVLKGGDKIYTPLFTLYLKKEKDFKAGVVVSKKLKFLAVERNRAKRRVYCVLDGMAKEKQISKGWIVVFLKDSQILKTPFSEMIKEISKYLA